jgi:hypothetical protein
MRVSLYAAVLLLFALLSNAAMAQNEGEISDDLPVSSGAIQIEVLVFSLSGYRGGAEAKDSQAALPSSGRAIQASGDGDYVLINSSERVLAAAEARLRASTETKPVLFTAWQQSLSDGVWVALGDVSQGADVSGRIRIANGKPLNVQLELNYVDGSQRRYRMRASRPGHFGETLLFDHPAFGALVRIAQTSAE